MLKGKAILNDLQQASGELSDTYSFHSTKIKNSSLRNGIKFYDVAIHKFMGNTIIKRLENLQFASDEEIRNRLRPDTEIGVGEWADISGLIAPKSEIEKLMAAIESGEVAQLKDINKEWEKMFINYYTYEWTWVYNKIEEFYGIAPEKLTAKDIIHIVEQWRDAVVWLDKMIYEDARKEFSLASRTGFGVDGSRQEKDSDFEQVRGAFESNPFVCTVLKHIEAKSALGQELIDRLAPLAK